MKPSQANVKARLEKPRYSFGKLLGESFQLKSACTGRGCELGDSCERSISREYNGPLLDMRGDSCINHSRYLHPNDQVRRLMKVAS